MVEQNDNASSKSHKYQHYLAQFVIRSCLSDLSQVWSTGMPLTFLGVGGEQTQQACENTQDRPWSRICVWSV